MAESQLPTALSFPTAGSGGAFTAAFYNNLALLQFSEQRALAADQQQRADTNAAYDYNHSVNIRAEPLRLTANQNAANSQGLAESGALTKTQSMTQTQYTQKDARLGEARENAIKKINAGEYDVKGQGILKVNNEVVREQEAQQKRAEEEGAAHPYGSLGVSPTNPATAINPGGKKTLLGPATPEGIVPYQETSSRGFVRVGAAAPASPRTAAAKTQPVSGARKAAAKKAIAVG
ncbi:MAG TPA: hypothetical protein VIH71_04705 [Solirubrobacteraceae bacterium]